MSLQIRQGTDAQRLTITPQSGELIYTIDTGYVYVGDGITPGGLPVSGNAGGGGYGNLQVSAFLPTYTGNLVSLEGNIATTASIRANNVSANNIGADNILANYFIGDGSQLTNINAANVTGTYGNANVAAYLPTYGGNISSNTLTSNIVIATNVNAAAVEVTQLNADNIVATYFSGNGAGLTNINAANIVGTYGNANVAAYMPTYLPTYSGNLAGNNLTISNTISASKSTFATISISSSNIALGNGASANGQNGIAVGFGAYANIANTISIGAFAGQNSANANVIAIGYGAGQRAGNNAICIGAFIEGEAQNHQNSIVLNAQSNTLLNTFTPGFFVAPVRNDSANTNAQMFYNQNTAEITWSKVSSIVKTPVRAASTVSLSTLTGSGYYYYNGPNNDGVNATIVQEFVSPFTGPLVIDGVTLRAGDRVLLKDEVGTSPGGVPPGLLTGKNGIYVVTDPGSASLPWRLIRAQDFNEPADIPNSLIYVEEGVLYGRMSFRNLNSSYNPIIIGTTDLVFTLEGTVAFVASMTNNYPGYPGQLVRDSNYLYVCMSRNSWMRTQLQSF